jgi:FlaA1/EpsC-like NDP-sugar epimerase
VADVRDEKRMQQLFTDYKPQMIFHAAAYKHVPLMEESPYEAIRVNVCGTKLLADLSVAHGVEKFVMVSTDKAVNPTNVMGATKRVAEIYISCLEELGKTKFITTRFGNVLGSNGSVIPLFKKQIEAGGPITVTHKEITRFFMTIPEACQLVLEAGVMGKGGEIYVFDMGESIKIYDVAIKMIQLSGLNFPEDIDIKISGLRPGEKLYEELLANDENTIPTYHDKIMIAKVSHMNQQEVKMKIEEICRINKEADNFKVVSLLKDLVPEYVSNNSVYEKLDKSVEV